MSNPQTEILPATNQVPATFSTAFRGLVDSWLMDVLGKSLNRTNEKVQKQAREDVARVARDLAGPAPSAAVAMLAQTAALCWVDLRVAEARLHAAEGLTSKQSEHRQRQIERCHNRWLRTLKALAEVRRLESKTPAVQVHVLQAVNVQTGQG